MTCPWCNYEYAAFNEPTERRHLLECPVYQKLPVAETRNGKQYVALPNNPEILVERSRIN